jgi:pimeloyl-ACP methyl ester carboxylesterase
MKTNRLASFVFPILPLIAACSSSNITNGSSAVGKDSGGGGPGDGGGTTAECPVVVKEADCDKTLRPFVFVHGTYGSGDNFAHVAALLGSNGFCQSRIVGVEYNSLGDKPGNKCEGNPAPQGCGKIDAVIQKVLADNPEFDQVDLAGHSQGTAHCGTYLQDPGQAAKVAHYINFSGVPAVGDVATLSLSSNHDLGGTPHHATGTNVETHTLVDEDHFAVAASRRSFVELYKYLKGEPPKYEEVQCGEDPVTIEGIAETFADNVPVLGKAELRVVGETPDAPGELVPMPPTDSSGHFGPVQVKRNVAYEIKGFDENGKLIGYQYFTPFKRDNYLVRLLSPSGNPLISGASTDKIVRDAGHVALVGRWAGGAFRQDLGASLLVDGKEVLTSGNAGTDAFSASGLNGGVVGFFMYDANLNKQTDLGLVTSGPFLAFTDVYMDATKSKFIELKFTPGSEDPNASRSVKIGSWPSGGTEPATVLAMFQ